MLPSQRNAAHRRAVIAASDQARIAFEPDPDGPQVAQGIIDHRNRLRDATFEALRQDLQTGRISIAELLAFVETLPKPDATTAAREVGMAAAVEKVDEIRYPRFHHCCQCGATNLTPQCVVCGSSRSEPA